MLDRESMIVVTGGAGFIGSHVVEFLNQSGYFNIVIVDELQSSEKWKNLIGLQFEDIIEKDNFFDWLDLHETEIDAYIHLGACCDTAERNASYLLENNYRFTIELMERAIAHNQRFIYASSASTYGDGSMGFDDDHSLLLKFRPMNMYAYSKHLVDLWALRHGVLDQVVGLKYFNVFGPRESHKGSMASPIRKMVNDLRSHQTISLFESTQPHLYGNGQQQRDFIYVKDAARMTCAFLHNQVGGIYNIGRGEAVTWNVLAEAVMENVLPGGRIQYIPTPSQLKAQYQNYTCANMKKYRELWDHDVHPVECWQEPYSIQEAVADYLKVEQL